MKLTVVLDNNTLTDRFYYAEPGVSYLIKDNGKNILFDVGYSDIFLKNIFKMKINLLELDYVVLSHGHLDHSWGLVPLIQILTEAKVERMSDKIPTLVAHPSVFENRTAGNLPEIGSILSKEKVANHFNLCLTEKPYWLTQNLVFLGEIKRKTCFEAKQPIGKVKTKKNKLKNDFIEDDSALAFKSSEGLVIITACSHSGICNIIEYAKEICKENRVIDIIGGFHLQKSNDSTINNTLEYLKKINPNEVHACHCTDLQSKIELAKVVNLKEVGVGLILEYKN